MVWVRLVIGLAIVGVLAVFGLVFLFAGLIVILTGVLVWQMSRWFGPKGAEPHRNMPPGARPDRSPTVEGEFTVVEDSRIEIIPPPPRPDKSRPDSSRKDD